jgi:4-amino-4-deoxy-L-arabinose transferase-like glycosyltransferase
MRRALPWLAAASVSLLFCLIGVAFIPYAGAQYDEVLFADSIYAPDSVEYATRILGFGKPVPLMLMTYIGSLKAALYVPVLRLLGNNHISLRGPVLLAGAATVFLFFLIARRLAGTRIALAVALLLATDAVFLLTCVFDWGPVALQHILFTFTLLAGFRYVETRRKRWLFAGGLASGLALWDKAIFVWLLAGFGLALLLCFRRELWSMARTPRLPAAALLGFLLGAAPFIYYNSVTRGRTFAANTEVDDTVPMSFKLLMIDRTMDGSGLFSYIVREQPEGYPERLRIWEKGPLWLSGVLRAPRSSWQHLLLVAALLLAPLTWFGERRRLAVFLLLGTVFSTLLMISTRNAGASQHHTILLWPVPQLILALVLGEIAGRWPRKGAAVALSVTLLCAASNAAILNQYLAQFISSGPTMIWTNAIRPLVNELGRYQGRLVFAADWGISEQVQFYGAGRIGFHRAADGVVISLEEPLSQVFVEKQLADDKNLFVTHTEGREAFAGVRQKLIDFAAARGYRDEILKVIKDRHGVPMFEIHEFRR